MSQMKEGNVEPISEGRKRTGDRNDSLRFPTLSPCSDWRGIMQDLEARALLPGLSFPYLPLIDSHIYWICHELGNEL